MPKTLLKKKYHDRTFVNPVNISVDDSKSNNETEISKINSNIIFNYIRPSFPPTLKIDDLIKNDNTSNQRRSLPNAFIVYRMALIKEYRSKNRKLPPMAEISKIAKNFWNVEPKYVKNFYESLVKEAKSIHKRKNVQIIMDKHMNGNMSYVKSGQTLQSNTMDAMDEVDNLVTYNVEQNSNAQDIMVLPIENAIYMENSYLQFQNSTVSVGYSSQANDVIFSDVSFDPNQAYITTLEQIIDNMIGTYDN